VCIRKSVRCAAIKDCITDFKDSNCIILARYCTAYATITTQILYKEYFVVNIFQTNVAIYLHLWYTHFKRIVARFYIKIHVYWG
jgi:hypothetical protein